LKPVCPVTSTRRPFQKPGSTLTFAPLRGHEYVALRRTR
jgi:hypothetical protein